MQTFFEWITAPLGWLVLFRTRALRQATLLRMLAVGVEKQIPVEHFLVALADESGGFWRRKLRGLADLLHSGVSIPDALDALPGLLPIDILVLIRVGAETGQLPAALADAASRLTRRGERQGSEGAASLVYLISLLLVMSLVNTFIMIWLIPKFKAIFVGFDTELPELTVTLIELSDWGATYWYIVALLGLVFLVAAGSITLEITGLALGWTTSSNRWLGGSPRGAMPLVLRGLGHAVDGGRPLLVALETILQRHPSASLRRRLADVEYDVARGADCWERLCQAHLLSRTDRALLVAAQRVGNLGWALRGLADRLERRTQHRARLALEYLRPVAMLAAGGVVGFIVIGLFLPLVKLIHVLSGEAS
ncbi:MAG: type II secretion system F family protein [Planctomycetales bacterium]